MKQTALAAILSVLFLPIAVAVSSQEKPKDACAEFTALVAKVYNFKDMNLSEAESRAKEKELDTFWTTVKARRKEFLPCLRVSVADPKSNPFFRFDGSNLLMSMDPSDASKAMAVDVYTSADLDMVGARRWVTVLSFLGKEGFDISKAGERWLAEKDNHFTLPEHGDYDVSQYEG